MSNLAEEAQNSKSAKSGLADFKGLARLWPFLRRRRGLILLAAALIPVISLLQMSLPLILRRSIDEGIVAGDTDALFLFGALYLGVVLLEYGTRAAQSLVAAVSVHGMVKDLRRHLINHIFKLRSSFHDRSMSGALVTRATSDFDNLTESLNQGILTSIVDLAVLFGVIAGMLVLDWRIALFCIILLPLVSIVVSQFAKMLKQAMLASRRKLATLNAFTQECLFGAATVKLLTAENATREKFHRYNEDYRRAQMRSVVLDASMFAVLDGISSIVVGGVLWVAISGFTASDHLSAGLIVAFVQYVQQLFEPLKQLTSKMAVLQGAFTAIDRIFGVLETREFVEGERKVANLSGTVEFRHVRFSYNPAQPEWVLDDVSFQLPSGSSTAIVGATGSGKSTIIKLLAKLYDRYEGHILLDGKELRELEEDSIRNRIAIVPQDIVLFNATIEFNVSLGLEGVQREDVQRAIELVSADQFVNKLPGGLDFILQEDGSNLSHGQRQLLVFARAVVRQPRLVILDEATSSIDPESERIVQAAMDRLFQNRSVIVIAHRLSTIERCTQILVVDRGRIVEKGTHGELLAVKGRYFELCQGQKSAKKAFPQQGKALVKPEVTDSPAPRIPSLTPEASGGG